MSGYISISLKLIASIGEINQGQGIKFNQFRFHMISYNTTTSSTTSSAAAMYCYYYHSYNFSYVKSFVPII